MSPRSQFIKLQLSTPFHTISIVYFDSNLPHQQSTTQNHRPNNNPSITTTSTISGSVFPPIINSPSSQAIPSSAAYPLLDWLLSPSSTWSSHGFHWLNYHAGDSRAMDRNTQGDGNDLHIASPCPRYFHLLHRRLAPSHFHAGDSSKHQGHGYNLRGREMDARHASSGTWWI